MVKIDDIVSFVEIFQLAIASTMAVIGIFFRDQYIDYVNRKWDIESEKVISRQKKIIPVVGYFAALMTVLLLYKMVV